MKKIGIVGRYSAERSLLVSYPYVAFAKYFCNKKTNIVVIDPITSDIIDNLDLLILPGGEDVDPWRYGEMPELECKNPNVHFEYFDRNVLPKYIDAKVPIFGICRGFQTLNVHFGGKLAQHIYQENSDKSRDQKVHDLDLNYNLPDVIKNLYPKKYEGVNSLHHQGIYEHILSENLVEVARNKTCHNIEAFIHKKLPIIGVQWHPEEIYDSFSINAIKFLLGV